MLTLSLSFNANFDLFVYVHSLTTDGMSHVKMKVHVARHKFYKRKAATKLYHPPPGGRVHTTKAPHHKTNVPRLPSFSLFLSEP